MKNENLVIQNFILEVTVIEPISDIVEKLSNNLFRDIDIQFLNKNLQKFSELAMKNFGMNDTILDRPENEEYLNDFVIQRFLERFKILLNFFKSFKE